ncbi:glycosyltransferase family 4 protein [Aestuariimicrobium soli]|uniref:glycosyltransferase family 4 protein n=1 Tax=Aestuariimicrobium soli TaxID=2035834 RepID=UPI003EBD3313
MRLVFDARWAGRHGIGRFARELRPRLAGSVVDVHGAHPVSPRGLIESELLPHRAAGGHERSATWFSPGYTPCLSWRGPHAFTVHDLIHLEVEGERSRAKDAYYRQVVRRAVRRPRGAVLTVSEYSRDRIADWAGVDPARITVVGNGVDDLFRPDGAAAASHSPYLLHVGNPKPHRNLDRVLQALAGLPDVTLRLVTAPDRSLLDRAAALGVADRIGFETDVDDARLAALYRGARTVVVASLHEGFGLPALEGMACGVPVVASNSTSLPEVVADAAVVVDPTDVEAIRHGIEQTLTNEDLRRRLATAGPLRAAHFRWDAVADRVNAALAAEAGEP